MKIVYSTIALLLIPATSAADAQSERELRGYNYGFANYRTANYHKTCDSTIGHCQEEICDIVSYNCAVAGPSGPQGPAGKHGSVGPAGRNGKDGLNGATGPVGPPGRQGARGEKGATGAPGAQGPPGKQGQPGYNGKDGLNGRPGADGKDGARGPPGPRGEEGNQGPQGRQGPAGPPGAAAAQLAVAQTCQSVSSSGDGIAMSSCENGLARGAVATCPNGSQMTGCNGISQDSSPLAVSCRIEGNQCICDGCDLFGGKKYYAPNLIAQARCCHVSPY